MLQATYRKPTHNSTNEEARSALRLSYGWLGIEVDGSGISAIRLSVHVASAITLLVI